MDERLLNPAEKLRQVNEILDKNMIEISISWAEFYRKNGKEFMGALLKFDSMRITAAFIVQSYRRLGILDECRKSGKDFTKYCEKLKTDHRWKKMLAELLLILYSIIN